MEEPESIPPDSEDVREQLEQQRTLAAQLREKLEQDEQQLASKEQKNEVCSYPDPSLTFSLNLLGKLLV